MPIISPGKFANPDFLIRIRKDLLLAWLDPVRDYLKRRGVALPEPLRCGEADGECEAAKIDYDKLAQIFLDPTPDMPAELLEALYIFREMDHDAAMDALYEEAARRGKKLGTEQNWYRDDAGNGGAKALPHPAQRDGSDDSALDTVVRAWLLDRNLVEAVHNRMEMSRPRSFQCFSTFVDPVPRFGGPEAEQLVEMERRLNAFYAAWKRGHGARVFPYRQEPDWVFLIRHAAPCRREGAMEDDEPSTFYYRPLRHDVLRYDTARGEMAVNCCGERERRVLLRIFGSCLFGNPDFFPGTAKYTLAPLSQTGRASLACVDVPGIERVLLTEVEVQFEEEPRHRKIVKAADVFELVECGRMSWPMRIEAIKRATFQVKFWRTPRPRRLTIIPCNRALYSREEDSPLLERFMQARGFIQNRKVGQ
ncbi:MAG: hypothetical protein C5B50_08280 [Verrucomicrobia bacterium]|nr:MAG: hypothetical protein C5B50_08280 [Verrucomicrobiota bacterium]